MEGLLSGRVCDRSLTFFFEQGYARMLAPSLTENVDRETGVVK